MPEQTISAKDLRAILFHIDNQQLTIEQLRSILFNVKDYEKPVAVGFDMWRKMGIADNLGRRCVNCVADRNLAETNNAEHFSIPSQDEMYGLWRDESLTDAQHDTPEEKAKQAEFDRNVALSGGFAA